MTGGGESRGSWRVLAGCAAAIGLVAVAAGGVATARAYQSDATTGAQYQAELEQTWNEIEREYAPEVRTLEDGRQVQRTPDDTSYFQMYYVNEGNLSYNTRYLDADMRGCSSCHLDLAQTVADMDFFHLELDNGLGTTTTIDECRICHDYGYGYVDKTAQLGTLIHGVHNPSGVSNNCMACHSATADGRGMQLWDDVKYDVMQGISSVSDVQATFSYSQDVTTPMFDASWYYTSANTENIARGYAGEELDGETFENWDITVSGLVAEPFTAKLVDLIDEAPVATAIVAMECIMNAPGGEAIANVEIEGIPISWLIEKAGGMLEGATAIMSYAPDGWGRASTLERYEDTDGYLVYKINGEYLDWENGFPVMTCWPGQGVPASIRWVNEISVVDTPVEELKTWDGWTLSAEDGSPVNDYNGGHMIGSDEEVVHYNNPNVGVTHFEEGQIISADEPYTFEGYAWSTNEKIATLEFSLDRGATWTAFDTSDSDRLAWVYWNFTVDLEPGAYVLQVRATTESGVVSYQPDRVFFNVK